ncbi:MAG: TolC family protein, partial [Bacteroidales bacterium]
GIYGVRNAKIELNRQTLQVEEVKFQLNQEVRKAMLNVLTAKKRRESASEWVSANQEAYRYTEERYFAEKATVFDLQQAKYNLEKSLSELVQAKFEYIFNLKILDFYGGRKIRF